VKVAILAKGDSLKRYPGRGGFDEVWGLNQLGQSLDLDKLFVMDDLKARLPHWTGPEFPEWLKSYDKPIITSRDYAEWPTSERFPLEDVAKDFGLPLGISFYSTPEYMIALAIHQGFECIELFGVDCANPKREETVRVSIGRWIAVAQARGVRVVTYPGSFFQWYTAPGICYEKGLYGYVGAPRIEELA
jgi:hypothetical protein